MKRKYGFKGCIFIFWSQGNWKVFFYEDSDKEKGKCGFKGSILISDRMDSESKNWVSCHNKIVNK